MTEELVKRLRHLHDLIEAKEAFTIPELAEAADVIEALTAANKTGENHVNHNHP